MIGIRPAPTFLLILALSSPASQQNKQEIAPELGAFFSSLFPSKVSYFPSKLAKKLIF